MAQQVRKGKYSEFNPEPSKWRHNKRNLDQATEALEVMVAKNYSKLALPCIAIYPDVDKNGGFVGFKVAAPDGPLKNYFKQEDTKKIFFDLIQDACIDAMAKKERKRSGEEVEASSSVLIAISLSKPPRPIWNLTLKELETFFSIIKSELAKKDGIKLKRKWPKLVDGKVTDLPTKIPSYDDVAETILPSSTYVPFQKFPLGNLQWRLKLVLAYFFTKHKIDPNNFATNIPDNFEPKKFSLEVLIEYSHDIEKSAKKNSKEKKKKVVEEHHDVPFFEEDDVNYDDSSEGEDTSEINAEAVTPTRPPTSVSEPALELSAGASGTSARTQPMPSRPLQRTSIQTDFVERMNETLPNGAIAVTIPRPKNVFFDLNENDDVLNMSHNTGTPQHSSEADDDGSNEVDRLAELEEEFNYSEELLCKMENTDIRNLLTGDKSTEPIVQVFNFQKLAKAQCFKSHAHDSKRATSKIIFSSSLNDKVEPFLKKQPMIKLTKFQLCNGSFLFIEDFEVVKILDARIGNPEYLTENEYENLKRNLRPNSNLPTTPTLVTKKMTSKYGNQLNLVPTRNASERIQKRSSGSNS